MPWCPSTTHCFREKKTDTGPDGCPLIGTPFPLPENASRPPPVSVQTAEQHLSPGQGLTDSSAPYATLRLSRYRNRAHNLAMTPSACTLIARGARRRRGRRRRRLGRRGEHQLRGPPPAAALRRIGLSGEHPPRRRRRCAPRDSARRSRAPARRRPATWPPRAACGPRRAPPRRACGAAPSRCGWGPAYAARVSCHPRCPMRRCRASSRMRSARQSG